ncbi:hypothetical protein H4R21_003565 [Coemansia helicoidea]|uniref:Uncharacterized protein n=1 Tax=Coemansia helicoidea TaxID=1286919 RepID=A0ACC1L1N3_9FUNG|nr:hypothetical protein H4R21_003565 [Coemansia helicoidea]
MKTRSTATASGPSTPPPIASPDKAVSTRLRSRTTSKAAAAAVDETPQTPTRRGRTAARKTSSELSDEAPATPTRRSTRAAAMRANEFLHETAELLSGRRRTPAAAKKTAGAESSGDDAPPTPTRRPRTPRTPAARTLAARRAAAAVRDSEGSEDELARSPLTLRALDGSGSGDEPHLAGLSLESPTAATAGSPPPESAATPRGRGRPPKATPASRKRSTKGAAAAGDLPPLHPELATAAQTLASITSASSTTSTSPRQSVDEGFRTAPETPEGQSPGRGRARPAEEEQAPDDISDLSDMEDPHFTAIMSAEAETATISAAGSIHGSVHGGSDDEGAAAPAALAKSSHVRFDSDVEPASSAEDDGVAGQVPAAQPAHESSDSDSDDDAPEVVTSKAAAAARDAGEEAVVPDHKGEPSSAKALKRRRARHRKRATAAQAAEEIKSVVAEAVRRKDLSHSMPAEFPEELRPAASEPKAAGAGRPVAERGDRLDASLLEAFGAEAASKRKGATDQAAADAGRRAKKHKKRRNGLSRVVSGIRVVAAKPATSTNLLEALSQGVSDKVQKFKDRQRGATHIARSAPLDSIARRRNQPAVSFFKP